MVKGAPKHGHSRMADAKAAPADEPPSSLSSLGQMMGPMPEGLAPLMGGTVGAALGAVLGSLLGAFAASGMSSDLAKGPSMPASGSNPVPPPPKNAAPPKAPANAGKGGAGSASGLASKSPWIMFPGNTLIIAAFLPKVSVLIGQGDEGSGLTFMSKGQKIKAGFYLDDKMTMNLMSEVINYKKVEQDIYVKVDYEYIPNMATREKDYYDVGMGAINVAPCESVNLSKCCDSAFPKCSDRTKVPPKDKPIKYTSPPWQVNQAGYLLDVKPHLHDGGVNMTLYLNGENKCTSKAVYGGTDGGLEINGEKWETITAYTPCEAPIAIKVGDTLTMDAYYDVSKHKLRPHSATDGEAEGMALATYVYAKPA